MKTKDLLDMVLPKAESTEVFNNLIRLQRNQMIEHILLKDGSIFVTEAELANILDVLYIKGISVKVTVSNNKYLLRMCFN